MKSLVHSRSMVEAGVAEVRGKRLYMEDRNIVCKSLPNFPLFSVFGVFDGHSGSKASEAIKELLIPTLETHIHRQKLMSITTEEEKISAIKTVLHNTIIEIDSLFASLYPSVKDGSTAIVAVVWSGSSPMLAVANVGDCRGLLSSETSFKELSQDHKASVLRERDRIEALGGKVTDVKGMWRVQGSLAVTRAIGDCHLKKYVIAEPETFVTMLTPQDQFFVLASDGVWDELCNQECVDLIRKNLSRKDSTATQAANEVVKKVLQLGGSDNVTTIVVCLNWNALQGGQAQL